MQPNGSSIDTKQMETHSNETKPNSAKNNRKERKDIQMEPTKTDIVKAHPLEDDQAMTDENSQTRLATDNDPANSKQTPQDAKPIPTHKGPEHATRNHTTKKAGRSKRTIDINLDRKKERHSKIANHKHQLRLTDSDQELQRKGNRNNDMIELRNDLETVITPDDVIRHHRVANGLNDKKQAMSRDRNQSPQRRRQTQIRAQNHNHIPARNHQNNDTNPATHQLEHRVTSELVKKPRCRDKPKPKEPPRSHKTHKPSGKKCQKADKH
ncbi:hypothetical protein SAMN04515648_4502 [Phyllobacterium sp. CL33Tsu]|uniref:hypothetical protein n=1 Tax=Phyllobacterium sp. CL33Tsu TaxID=1798191 RepID=UPI0008F0B24B|nr:hypothetical protein [Phyllobacterium sp. CL33Tsu]SFJ54169.1 hypothetical protein SAMN04515648_4502 [Phyllobacterium sp. CL33Tsu]